MKALGKGIIVIDKNGENMQRVKLETPKLDTEVNDADLLARQRSVFVNTQKMGFLEYIQDKEAAKEKEHMFSEPINDKFSGSAYITEVPLPEESENTTKREITERENEESEIKEEIGIEGLVNPYERRGDYKKRDLKRRNREEFASEKPDAAIINVTFQPNEKVISRDKL